MKRTFTFLMTALFLCVGMVKAAVTDVPEMSTEGSIKWYTISNTRSTSGKYLYWTESGVKDANTLSGSSLFYFTGDDASACYIHNAATNLLFSGKGAWTEAGVSCKISETPHSSKAGVAIEFSGTSLNENNYDNGFTTWSANDAGSIFVIAPATVSIEEAIAGLDANKAAGNTIMGEYKYEEESYNNLVAALAALNSATGAEAATAFESCVEIMAGLTYVMPEEGKFYVIECPLFAQVQGVSKGLNGTPGWNTLDLTDTNYYWTVEVNNGTYALKNLGTGTYLGGTAMSEAAVYATLNRLGEQQFNIVVNGTTVHANNHGNGSNASGNIVSWGGSANSASAWQFIEKADPTALQEVAVTYNFTYGGEVKYTQTTPTLVGEVWPAISVAFPYTVSAVKPEGTIAAEDHTDGAVTKEIPLALGELPFVAAADVESISTWYYVRMHSNTPKYIQYLADQTYIEWTDAEMDETAKNTYSWAFVGNIFDGFKVVNKAAAKALQSDTNGNVTWADYAEGSEYVLSATRETSEAAKSGFCLRRPDANKDCLNASGGKVAHWWDNDAGSTFMLEVVENEPVVDPNDYTSYIKNADLSTSYDEGETSADWDLTNSKGIRSGYARISGKVFDFSQTITLPAGQYMMTAKAAYRFGGDEQAEYDAIQAGDDTHLAKLYAATASYKYEVDVMNRYEGASDTDYAAGNGSTTVNGKFVPNSSDAVKAWFDADQYINELVFNVQEDGDVKIGIAKDVESSDYTNIGAWTLTRIGDAEADPEVEEPEETVDLDMTHKVSRDWEGKTGDVTIDGIAMSERYEGNADPVGDQLWQTVTGLENGKYTVKVWANARVAWVGSPATDGKEGLTYIFANNVEKSIAVLLNPNTNGNVLRTLEGVEVTDGTLRMGMTKKAAGSNWHSIQIESLTLHATKEVVVNIAKAELQATIDEANAVSPVTEALATAIAAAQAVYDNSNDKDEVVAATAALKTAIILANNTNAVAGATEENPVLTNFVVNGTFDSSKDPWKSTTGATNQGTASNQQGAFTGNFFENWNGSNYTGKLYQVIENIPNGVYELSIAAFVETFDGSAQFVYANGDKVALTTGAPTAYTVRTIVKNNKIEVGFEQTAAVNRWSGIDNISLKYLGEASNEALVNAAKEAFTAAYEEFGAALTACQAMMLKMSFAEIDDAAYQLNEQLETTTDVDALNTMAETLAEATASLKEINEVYAGYDVFVQKFKAAAEISEPTTAEAAELLEFNMYGGAGMQATSLEALAQAVETIKADYFTYIANAKLLDGNKFDLTFMIQNPGFEMNLDGWTGVKANRIGGEGYDGVGGIAEIGEWGASSWDASMSQAITNLPNGKYVVKAAWMAASGIEMTFAANAGETTVTGIGDMGGNIAKDGSVVEMGQGHRGWQYVEVEGLVEDGTLTISVSSSSAAQQMWSNADAFELYYAGVPAPAEPEYLTVVGAKVGDVAIVEGAATVESISTIDVIFDRPVAKAEDAGWATLADSYGPTNLDVEVLAAEEGSSEYVVRFSVSQEFNGEFTEAGEYTLNIPEGFIVGAEGANFINAAIAATITIEAAPATPLTVTNVTVGEDVMEDFTVVATPEDMIKVNFDGQFYFQGTPVIVDAENNDASEYFMFANGRDVDGSNSYIFQGMNAGTYTITMPKTSFMQMMSFKAPAEDIVLTVQIYVPVVEVEEVTLDKETIAFTTADSTVTLVATVAPAEATDQTITWSSSNEAVATVDAEGNVKSVANGTTTITATSANGVAATCEVTVNIIDTAIKSINADANAVIYDIHGRRVTKMVKGFYIVNGKKVVIK